MATRRTTKAKASEKTVAAKSTASAKAASTAKDATAAKAASVAKAATTAKAAKTVAKAATTAKAAKTVAKTATTAKAAKTVAKAAKTVAAVEAVEQVGKAATAAKKTVEAAESTASALALEIAEELKQVEGQDAEKAVETAAAEEAPAKAASEKKAPAKRTSAKKTSARKTTTKKASAKKAAVEEAPEQKAEKAPADEAPVEKAVVEDAAVEKAVAEEAPAEKAAVKVSAQEVPAEEAPVEEVPAKEAPVAEEAPAEQAAAAKEEPATEEVPVEEAAAAEETPVEEAPVDDAAVDEGALEQVETDQAPVVLPEFSDVPGVLIAAAECAPLVKVGGLADVVGALPKYLKKLGIDARIIMPFHRAIKERYACETQHICDFQASLGWRSQYVGVERLELDGTVYYFIDNEFYFGGPIYCGGEFEGEQYAFFTRAVLDSIPQLDFDVKILHCNDWHTAMMPLLVRTQYQGGMQSGLRTVLTIHNLHFQGQFSHEFDRDLLRVDDSLATPQFIEHYGCDNMLKAGIVFADKVTTVSPTYSQEICQPELGESLDGVLRSRGGDLWGILNGIDVDVWNPQTDPALPERYSTKSLWRKTKNRDALLEELGLAPAGENTAVIGMVGRLTPQKGIDLVARVLDELMGEDVRVIVLGSGDADYENFLRDAENRHKGRLCSYIGYNGDLSHRIYAGSDLFLMPSLFEPCGISQMIAMRYGTLPIVRETGGLKDTVLPYNEFTGEGTGFSFANYNAHEMLGVIRWALGVWRNPDVRKRLITQAMEADFSFDRCARTYAELYRTL